MKSPLIIACVGLCILGCDNSEEPKTKPSEPSKPVIAPDGKSVPDEPTFATSSDRPQPKLDYAYKIEPNGEKSTVTWTATVPTGGWTMTTDSVLVEESMGKVWARIYVTIEAPNPANMVTQAFQTLTAKHEADKKVDRVELSVRRTTKGDDPTFKPMYAIVKSDPR